MMKGRTTMKYAANEKPTIRPERIEQARKLLQDLPEKDTRISKKEAVVRLEADIHKAFKKGYTSKEIALLLKSAGVTISMQLIKEVLDSENRDEALQRELSELNADDFLDEAENDSENQKSVSTEDKESVLPKTKENAEGNRAKNTTKRVEKIEEEVVSSKNGRFEIIPDRPNDEL